ncbi:MAG: DUF3262 family protein [Alicycliphilus sp.]|nr:MAG: DUF3262 family protein [Alicycliphilus sp.]
MPRASRVPCRRCAATTASDGTRRQHMNAAMRSAFQSGSGIDPLVLKSTLGLIAVALILVVASWFVVQLIDAYRDDRLTTGDMVLGSVRLLILVALVVFVIV